MKTAPVPVSDYEFLGKMLERLRRHEQTRRLTANETRSIHALRERWLNDGRVFAFAATERENLQVFVGKIEKRLKTYPYPKFC